MVSSRVGASVIIPNTTNTSTMTTKDAKFQNPVYQIDCVKQNKGKRVAATKRRVRWRFGFSNQQAIQQGLEGPQCRGAEHEVVLVWSLTSGKQLILADGQEVHWAKSSKKESMEFTWTMNGSHELKVVAHASSSFWGQQSESSQFDLFIDGLNFWDFPKIFQLGKQTTAAPQPSKVTPPTRPTYRRTMSVPDFCGASQPQPVSTVTPPAHRSPTSSMDMSAFPQQLQQQQQRYSFAWSDTTPRSSFNENAYKGYPIQAIATPDVSRSASPLSSSQDINLSPLSAALRSLVDFGDDDNKSLSSACSSSQHSYTQPYYQQPQQPLAPSSQHSYASQQPLGHSSQHSYASQHSYLPKTCVVQQQEQQFPSYPSFEVVQGQQQLPKRDSFSSLHSFGNFQQQTHHASYQNLCEF